MHRLLPAVALLLLVSLLPVPAPVAFPMAATPVAASDPIPPHPFETTWERTDLPVLEGFATRTWMWGPQPLSYGISEPYAEAEGGRREVQYFDKARMEITHTDGDRSSPWYVTNGLLVVEMLSGDLQLGDASFEQRDPSTAFVAGDDTAAEGITYAALAALRDAPAAAVGDPVTAVLTPESLTSASVQSTADPPVAGITAAHVVDVAGLSHSVASVFWEFMHSDGLVAQLVGDERQGMMRHGPLFPDPFYATGLPVTEAYWTTAQVGGRERDVLLQCFERRCLTFTPDNPVEWQVEAGNVGLHYRAWRYGADRDVQPGPSTVANHLAERIASATSDTERYAVLLEIFTALGVPVVDGSDGTLLTAGRIRGDGDLYLYDLEVQLLAQALVRGDTRSIWDISTDLSGVLLPTDHSLGALEHDILDARYDAQAHPDDLRTLGYYLLRQLGLYQSVPYDIMAYIPNARLQFDALQHLLIVLDVVTALADGSLPVAAAAAPACAVSQQDGPASGLGLIGARYSPYLDLLPPAQILTNLHALLLADAIEVRADAAAIGGHMGHGGPGDLLTFGVTVRMRDAAPSQSIACGWVQQVEFPIAGLLADAAVRWRTGYYLTELAELECPTTCTIDSDALAIYTRTDINGYSAFNARLRAETPPVGDQRPHQRGTVAVDLLDAHDLLRLQTLGGEPTAPVAQHGATIAWDVTRHLPITWDVTITADLQAGYVWLLDDGSREFAVSETRRVLAQFSVDTTGILTRSVGAVDGVLSSTLEQTLDVRDTSPVWTLPACIGSDEEQQPFTFPWYDVGLSLRGTLTLTSDATLGPHAADSLRWSGDVDDRVACDELASRVGSLWERALGDEVGSISLLFPTIDLEGRAYAGPYIDVPDLCALLADAPPPLPGAVFDPTQCWARYVWQYDVAPGPLPQ